MKNAKRAKQPQANLLPKPSEIPTGVVGMGLMGRSIVACLLSAGHPVIGITSDPKKVASTRKQVGLLLTEMRGQKLLRTGPETALRRLTVTTDYGELSEARLVVESVVEDLESKRTVFARVEDVVAPDAVIGSNTSGMPVTELQRGRGRPERFIGLHWAEPAHITRFLEVVCGSETDPKYAEQAQQWAERWGKEPTLVRRDVPGFITNRIMYAMLREAFHLVESGVATVEDVDRSVRNDLGYWITFAGPFRFMDLTGIPAYRAVMRGLLADLDTSTNVPALMEKVVESGAKGVQNAKGFYPYTPEEAKRWERDFLRFSYEIRQLALKYRAEKRK